MSLDDCEGYMLESRKSCARGLQSWIVTGPRDRLHSFLKSLSGMAKKGKDDAPTAHSVANRDIMQRLNFLYQASVYLNTIPSSKQSTTSGSSANAKSSCTPKEVKKARKRRNKSLRNIATASELSRSYITTMKSVGQKTMVKMCVPPISFDLEIHLFTT